MLKKTKQTWNIQHTKHYGMNTLTAAWLSNSSSITAHLLCIFCPVYFFGNLCSALFLHCWVYAVVLSTLICCTMVWLHDISFNIYQYTILTNDFKKCLLNREYDLIWHTGRLCHTQPPDERINFILFLRCVCALTSLHAPLVRWYHSCLVVSVLGICFVCQGKVRAAAWSLLCPAEQSPLMMCS